MIRCILVIGLIGATAPAHAQSADETALFLLTQQMGVVPDQRGHYVFETHAASDETDPHGPVRVKVDFAPDGPCRYMMRVGRRRAGGIAAGEAWSQIRIDFNKASRIEFKPLFDDHGPDTYLITGLPNLMCVRDAVMADCSDRITVEKDARNPFSEAAVRQAFDRLHTELCKGDPS